MDWNKIKDGAKVLAEKGIEVAKEKRQEKKNEKELIKQEEQAFRDRIAKMDKEGTAYCPKCYSTDISANKRGWKVTTGLLGSSKIIITCLKCGHKFKPGSR